MTPETLRKWLNNILIADAFLVMAGFSWFVFSITGAFLGFPSFYRFWIKFWFPLFQPAIGILIVGAVASGVWGWAVRKLEASKSDR